MDKLGRVPEEPVNPIDPFDQYEQFVPSRCRHHMAGSGCRRVVVIDALSHDVAGVPLPVFQNLALLDPALARA
jgi:hypothetical protein